MTEDIQQHSGPVCNDVTYSWSAASSWSQTRPLPLFFTWIYVPVATKLGCSSRFWQVQPFLVGCKHGMVWKPTKREVLILLCSVLQRVPPRALLTCFLLSLCVSSNVNSPQSLSCFVLFSVLSFSFLHSTGIILVGSFISHPNGFVWSETEKGVEISHRNQTT